MGGGETGSNERWAQKVLEGKNIFFFFNTWVVAMDWTSSEMQA